MSYKSTMNHKTWIDVPFAWWPLSRNTLIHGLSFDRIGLNWNRFNFLSFSFLNQFLNLCFLSLSVSSPIHVNFILLRFKIGLKRTLNCTFKIVCDVPGTIKIEIIYWNNFLVDYENNDSKVCRVFSWIIFMTNPLDHDLLSNGLLYTCAYNER